MSQKHICKHSKRSRVTVGKTDFGPVSDPFLVACSKTPQNTAKQAPGGQKPRLAVHLGHSEGWKPPKVGVGTGNRCPRNHDLVRLARDTANFQFRTARRSLAPNRPKLGQYTPFKGQNPEKTRPKGSPHVARVDSVRERGPQTPVVPVSEPLGPVFGEFGPALARFWARAKTIPFGPAQAPCRSKTRTLGRTRTPQMIF